MFWVLWILLFLSNSLQAEQIDSWSVKSLDADWTFTQEGSPTPRSVKIALGLLDQGYKIPIKGKYRIAIHYSGKNDGLTQGVYLDRIQSIDKTYWNGKLIGSTGEFDPYSPNWIRPRFYPIPTHMILPGENVLEVEIECRESRLFCGIFRSAPKVGDYDKIKEDLIYEDLVQVTFAVLFLGIFLQQAIAHFLNRYSNASLFLSLSAILYVGWRVAVLNKTHYLGIPFELIVRVFFICQTLFPAFLILFVYALFEKKPGIFVQAILGADFIIAFLHLYSFSPDQRFLMVYFWEILLGLKIIALVSLVATHYKSSGEGKIILIGALLAAFLGISDVVKDVITGKNQFLFQYGMLVFLFAGVMGIAVQNARARKDLKELNESLETLVEIRTQELEKQYRLLNEEIIVAAGLQSKLIPGLDGKIGRLLVNSVYVPAEKIGGDYFDSYAYGEDKIQFLLCDVAGHGISAALIASMLKISFLELAPKHSEPADLLIELNARLVPVVEKNFITAVAATFDLELGEVRYSLAGHPPPVLVREESEEPIIMDGKGSILGWRKEIQLGTWREKLKRGDRFFFYTDGITEAISPEKEMFGEARLISLLRDSFSRNPRNLNEEILANIKDFAGNKLPDDVTYLTVDVI
ncbi:serine/threonine protein phosphatase [Leptospira perolatii]|uniref:Serine/threonine protein phosphatase n=1 Tax=Leptospira perolatii TaxID=2023191 RepID=A0A2M9ZIQ9_9LEPT|nr:PP2C family protein-serine/threonine phosphatase [Leptospira perolatii]PJZ68172.1 serine/threonine protein phosphatase [Leptospira perolatii]PJZ71950.1 serine/threonine protein phosphatase [Leptospira perolatii]